MRHNKAPAGVTIIDVAREAGVSYATVSRVINNKDHVRADKRDRVLRAMERLGYTVNQQARSLAGGRSQVIGLLVHDLNTSYIGEIIRGVDSELATAEYDLMLYTTHRRKTRESSYVTTIARGLADGLLIVLPRNIDAYLESLQRHAFPYVLVDYHGPDRLGPTVGASNQAGAYGLTEYLINLGHRRIGFITGALDQTTAGERLAGHRAALAAYGIPEDPSLIVVGDFLQPLGYTRAHELLALSPRPSAIFASNDVTAFGAMEAARERGLDIPGDISIAGFDNIASAAYVHPSLTTVHQPLEEMGRAASRLLLQYIEQPDSPVQHVELPTRLIVRHSCRPLTGD